MRIFLRDTTQNRVQAVLMSVASLGSAAGAVAAFTGVLPNAPLGVAVLLAASTVLMLTIGVMLTRIRTVVSAAEVRVTLGAWGPRVDIARVRGCRVVPYDWKRFGGWGIKRARDGTWAYVLRATGDVVELTWTDDAGDEKKALFSATHPAAVVNAIERARTDSRAAP